MEGIFEKKTTTMLSILCFFIMLALFNLIMLLRQDRDWMVACLTVLCVYGVFTLVACGLALRFNKNAFFRLTATGIDARFGWRTVLRCDCRDVAFCSAQKVANVLDLRLKNGKSYHVAGLTNAKQICQELRSRMERQGTASSGKELEAEALAARKMRNRSAVATVVWCVMMFVLIFLVAMFTGDGGLSEFSGTDWTIFWCFVTLEVVCVVLLFRAALKCGQINRLLPGMGEALERAKLREAPLPGGNPVKVYMAPDDSVRLVVFQFPSAPDVYYSAQRLNKAGAAVTVYTSQVFPSLEALMPSLPEGRIEV